MKSYRDEDGYLVCEVTASTIVDVWGPGSQDAPWDWMDEATDCLARDAKRMEWIRTSIIDGGYVETDDLVTLGNDGRIWDGHHRIVAMLLLYPHEPMQVKIAPKADEW